MPPSDTLSTTSAHAGRLWRSPHDGAMPISFTARYSKGHVQLPVRMFVAGFYTLCSACGPEAALWGGIEPKKAIFQ